MIDMTNAATSAAGGATTAGAATTGGTGPALPDTAWRTRDIVVAAVIGVAFGVVFWVWGFAWSATEPLNSVFPVLRDLLYAVWLVPAVLAPLIIRKPGAALFAEMVAAGVSALLGSQWGVDTLLSGFVQGAAAELVFAFTLYRSWTPPVLAIAAVASAAAAWAHDWVLYYADVDMGLQIARLVLTAISALVFVAGGSILLERSLRRAGVLEGFPGLTAQPLPIRADGVGFTYAGRPTPALRDIDLAIEAGQVLLVVGPSGSGKSTLARAIAGLIPSEIPGEWSGSLKVGGLEVSSASRVAAAALVGLVFQDPASQLVMERAGDDVAFGLENRAWPLGAMRGRVPESLKAVGLAGFAGRRSARLSGGEQQRLAIAGVLAADPGVVVLDEPTANLDPTGTAAVYDWLRGLAASRAATIVLVEHRVELAWGLADTVLALDRAGRPIDVGDPTELLARSRERLANEGIWLPDDRSGSAAQVPGTPPRLPPPTRPSAPPVLELREAWYGYERGVPVLHGVSLEIGAGERVALVGDNGSGKSTLLRLALGLLRPTAGEVRLLANDPGHLTPSQLAARAGFAAQDPELGFVGDTVVDEVELGLSSGDMGWAYAVADRLRLPISMFGDRSPYRLSGGEQRRLSLITALARRPSLLILDEPTFGQDRNGHAELVAILEELAQDGTAIFAATHDERFVTDFADRVVELDEGWLQA